MPSTYRFMIQDNKYKDKILKNKAKAVVESSLSLYWYSFGLNDKQICCIKRIDKESLNIRKTCKLTVDDVYNYYSFSKGEIICSKNKFIIL